MSSFESGIGDGTFSFPVFHHRSADLGAADLARIGLARATREFMRQAFLTEATVDSIEEAARAVEELTRSISSGPVEPGTSAAQASFMDRSPLYGAMNPLAMPMEMDHEPDVGEFGAVTGRAVFTDLFEGPPGHVHGGFIAAAFDEVLGMAQSLTGRPGMTGRLTVTYRSPTPLHATIVFRGWVDRVEGRKIFTVGTAHNGETLCAESEGLFLSFSPEMADRLRKGRDVRPDQRPQ